MKLSVDPWIPTFARWSLLGVIVASVLALGSLPPEPLLAVTLLATLSAAASLAGRGRAAIPPVVWVGLALTGFTALQALPLPAGLVGAIAPANRDVWESAYQALREPAPRWLPLSLDPGATCLEVVKGWLYCCVFTAAFAVGARRGAGFGATAILASTLIFALVCLAHGLTDATRVFGVYTPTIGGSGFGVSPLLNPNNRASYLNLGALCGASLLAARGSPLSRWLLALALPAILGVSLLTGSRGGLAGLTAGVVVLGLLLRSMPRGSGRDAFQVKHLLLVGTAVLGLGAAFALAAAGPRLRHLLLEQNGSKLTVMVVALQLLPAHFWTGIGRGSFESVFPALRTATDNTVSSHPENFLVQWTCEWGVPVAVAGLVILAVLLRPRNWGVKRGAPACGLFAGVFALGVQNLVDLGSEVPGIMVAAAAAAGFAFGARAGRSGSQRRLLPLITLGLGATVLLAGAQLGRNTLASDREWLRELGTGDQGWQSFRRELREAMLRHPAEPYFPRLAAYAAWKSDAENPVPWIGHALTRGMSAGRTHYLLGGYLASRGKKAQAALELRLAATYDPSLSNNVAKLAFQLTQAEDELSRVVPDGAVGARVLSALSKRFAPTKPELATALLRQAVARDPDLSGARMSLVHRLLDDVDNRRPSCADPTPCLDEATRLLGSNKESNGPEALRLRARVLIASGNAAEAVRLLSQECRRAERPLPCIASWVDAARRARDRQALHQAVVALESEPCSAADHCNALLWQAGEAALSIGDSDFALRTMERSAIAQRSTGRWRDVARIARQNGQPARAAAALGRARVLDPNDATVRGDLDSLRHDTVEELLRK